MKKSVLLLAMAFGATATFAQDLVSKKGETILPEANDWAIVLDGTPFVQFIGNSFNGATSNTLFGNYPDTNPSFAIVAKMFKDAQTAYRAKLRIGMGSTTNKALVNDVTSTTTPPAQVEDVFKTSGTNILLGGGLEMRRGNTRLQGMYGGEALIWFGGGSASYDPGNALSSTYTAHTNGVGGSAGLLESKSGSIFGLGVRGFVGAEYFIFSKIAIGVEYGWGIGFQSMGEGEATVETWNGTAAEKTTTKTAGSSTFAIDTDINGRGNTPYGSAGPSGSLNVTLHF